MLPAANRLPSSEIPELLRRGRRLSGPWFVLISQPNHLDASRFAFITSARVDKRATKRNRIKRLLREAVRLLLPKIMTGSDIIFVVKKIDPKITIDQVKPEVTEILTKANLLTSP